MRKFSYGVILAGTLLSHVSFAADAQSDLERASTASNPLGFLEDLKAQNPEAAWSLCQEILDANFFATPEAQRMGVIKSRKVSSYCQELRLERQKAQPGSLTVLPPPPSAAARSAPPRIIGSIRDEARQKFESAQQEASRAAVSVSPIPEEKKAAFSLPEAQAQMKKIVKRKEVQGLEAQQEQIRQEEVAVAENVAILRAVEDTEVQRRADDYKRRLDQVRENIRMAQESYDNLKAIIGVMREDMKSMRPFYPFNRAHVIDSDENFLRALKSALPTMPRDVLDQNSLAQLQIASINLQEAIHYLAQGNQALEVIIREMEQMMRR